MPVVTRDREEKTTKAYPISRSERNPDVFIRFGARELVPVCIETATDGAAIQSAEQSRRDTL